MLRIFYCCYGGAHTSVTAAGIHLGYLPKYRIPDKKEFYNMPFFDGMPKSHVGIPVFMGADKENNHIYVVGMKSDRETVIKSVYSFLDVLGVEPREIMIIDALVTLNYITAIGGFLSRKLELVKIGRPLTVWGLRNSYAKSVKLVKHVNQALWDRNMSQGR